MTKMQLEPKTRYQDNYLNRGMIIKKVREQIMVHGQKRVFGSINNQWLMHAQGKQHRINCAGKHQARLETGIDGGTISFKIHVVRQEGGM